MILSNKRTQVKNSRQEHSLFPSNPEAPKKLQSAKTLWTRVAGRGNSQDACEAPT